MPIQTVSGTETLSGTPLQYYLIAFDAAGNEQEDGLMSQKLLEALSKEPITDVFLISHGWQGDVPAAKNQFDRWISAMAANEADLAKIKQNRPGFNPLLIGLHWPSLPWGDETLEEDSVSFDPTEVSPVEKLVDEYADRIANTEAARQALSTIFTAAMDDMAPEALSPEAIEAYKILDREASLGSEGEGAAPGSDREPFDPEGIFEAAANESEEVSFGGGFSSLIMSPVVTPMRLMSFWKMKDRARQIGETGGFQLLTKMQKASSDRVRFHLMGHSFGCIVVSATISGPNKKGKLLHPLVRPVDSVTLVQGALSIWSYCADIPVAPGRVGYFHPLIAENRVAGPMITTQSEHDTAVCQMYRLAAPLGLQVSFDPTQLPKYAGVGDLGINGPGLEIVDMKMLSSDEAYNFEPGKIYNLESSHIISDKGNLLNSWTVGAHGDFAKPEVAHAVWSAASGR